MNGWMDGWMDGWRRRRRARALRRVATQRARGLWDGGTCHNMVWADEFPEGACVFITEYRTGRQTAGPSRPPPAATGQQFGQLTDQNSENSAGQPSALPGRAYGRMGKRGLSEASGRGWREDGARRASGDQPAVERSFCLIHCVIACSNVLLACIRCTEYL